jgi:hypothetical protein
MTTYAIVRLASEADFVGHAAHAQDGLGDDLVQGHANHFAALFDDGAIDAGGEGFGLVFFLHALEFQIHDAL